MAVTKQQVLQGLARVMSPRNIPLVDAGVLSDVVVSDGKPAPATAGRTVFVGRDRHEYLAADGAQ